LDNRKKESYLCSPLQ